MKNDLTEFEKNLLKVINLKNRTKYNYKNLMQWSTDKKVVEEGLREGEKLYKALSCFVAIKLD